MGEAIGTTLVKYIQCSEGQEGGCMKCLGDGVGVGGRLVEINCWLMWWEIGEEFFVGGRGGGED